MTSYMVLHITDNYKAYKISKRIYEMNKSTLKLANQNLLQVMLIYDTYNRKPSKLIKVEFDRITVDSNSFIIYSESSFEFENNTVNYIFSDANELALLNKLPLPRAPVIPNQHEKVSLYEFIDKKYPFFHNPCVYLTEQYINIKNNIYSKNKKLVLATYANTAKSDTQN
ncbi:hypothetical protein ACJDU8_23550 [Clostridium sp. WILCCON 0269]|uniref:Uncharacterized protein n=1 Tax=Candidatus Clostridium eludens TaxID=3381663 RepID=A0ABW8SRR1_9CLOT